MPQDARALSRYLAPAIAILFVGAALIAFNGGIAVGSSNHVGLLPVVRRLVNPAYLPGDFSIELRLYHHRVFARILAILTTLAGEDNAVIMVHIASYLALAAGLYVLCQTLDLSIWYYVAAGLILATNAAWTGLGLEENTFAGGREIQPTTPAGAFVLFGTAALIKRRWVSAALMAGLSTLMHLQIGLIFAIIISPVYLISLFRRELPLKRLPLILAAFLLPALPALIDLRKMFARGVAASTFTLEYLQMRMPHHFELMSAKAAIWIVLHIAVMLFVYVWLKRRRSPTATAVGILALLSLTLTVLILIHFADYYWLHWLTTLKAQFPRVSPLITVFGTLSGLALIQHLQLRYPSSNALQIAVGLICVALILDTAWRFREESLVFSTSVMRYRDQPGDWNDVCRWIRANGPSGTVYLAPPARYGFSYLTDRSSVVEFKINPDGGQFLKEWYERMTDLSGGKLPEQTGLAMRRPLDRAFGSLDRQALLALSDKYSATMAVLPASSKAEFPVLYQNKAFRVVELREP